MALFYIPTYAKRLPVAGFLHVPMLSSALSGRGTLVLSITEAQKRHEDVGEQHEAYAESVAIVPPLLH